MVLKKTRDTLSFCSTSMALFKTIIASVRGLFASSTDSQTVEPQQQANKARKDRKASMKVCAVLFTSIARQRARKAPQSNQSILH